MIGSGSEIVCRRCEERIPRNIEKCPHCGASLRKTKGPMAAVVIGVIIFLSSLLSIGDLWPYALFGAVIAGGAGYLLWEKRNRIQLANGPN